jgi:Ca-activated chloride channel family protein
MTPEKEEAAHKFIAYLAGKSAQQRAMEMGLRPIMPEIEIASPLDESFGVANRLPDIRSFTVPDENVLKRIRDLWEDVKTPATIALLLDRSGSMKGMPIDNAKTGAIQFIQSMKPRDELVIINFNQSVSVLAELGNIQQNGEASINRIQGIFADGGTALHDAIRESYETLKKLKTSKPNRRYSILLLSDGRDTSSKMNRHDLIDYLPSGEEHDIPKIFAIAYGEEADKELLSEIVRRTNGRLFISSPEEIVKTYKELSANF